MSNRYLLYLAFVGCLSLGFSACTEPAPTNNATSDTNTAETATDERAIEAIPSQPAPDCPIIGTVLEDNQYWLKDKDLLAVIKADSSTTTEEFGPSHRIFEVLDGRSCAVKFTETLPVNTSPDFPYYLAPIQYNKVSNLIGIQGMYDIYVCDLDNGMSMTQLKPEYFSERPYDDPQSGMIQRLEVWEDYLFGHAQDLGTFAFDLSDKANPKPVLPFAEWVDKDISRYHSLFLVPAEGGYQAIMPYYDLEDEEFVLSPLFDVPQQLSLNVNKSARDNQFLILRHANDNSKVYPINLGVREVANVPAEVLQQNTKAIITWLEAQEK